MRFRISSFMAGALLMATSASAASITPTFSTFGTLAGATFGGSGIPNTAVAITTINLGSGIVVTLGLTATPRTPSTDPVTNDGAGTFTAQAAAGSTATTSRWNVDYFAGVAGGSAARLDFVLRYDTDPGVGTDESQLGRWDLSASYGASNPIQDSQNIGFGFLQANAPPTITPPAFGTFNPLAVGEYSFELLAFDHSTGSLLGTAAINVDTVPEPGTIALFATGLFGIALGVARRRHR